MWSLLATAVVPPRCLSMNNVGKNCFPQKQLKETVECEQHFPSFQEAISVPWKLIPRRTAKLYFAMRDQKKLCEANSVSESHIPDTLLERLISGTIEFPPACAIVGGILAQEVIKAVSGKGDPVKNFFYYDAQDGKGKSSCAGSDITGERSS
ncbi:hypothetical protein Bca4012_093442 [Brassica carinata]